MTIPDPSAPETASSAIGAGNVGMFPLAPRKAYAAAVLAGVLYWLAFPGKLALGSWHGLLAFVAFVPLWLALLRQTPRRAVLIGVIAGTTMNVAGFTWLVDMLQTFSGFPASICFFFTVLVCTYQGGRFGLMGWLFARSSQRGWPPAAVFVVAFIASELAYPLLFPWYFAATTYQLPALSQTAELGGPILVGAMLVGVNLAIAEPLVARLEQRKLDWPRVYVPLGVLAFALVFAAVRIPAVDARAQASDPVHVGVVQGNLGVTEKREDPAEGLRRHLQLTNSLKAKGVQFVVWSESSVTMPFPERGYQMMMHDEFAAALGVPTIIGSVLVSMDSIDPRLYNTALSMDARGQVVGRYDKEFLLAFGEYLPLGETIPKLYEWSPNSGHFTPGTVVDPLPVTIAGITHPVSALICYEDILPSFTNRVANAAQPDLLVNMSNDAWFGDTAEPWEHLALAQMRAIEHRRYLLRSTNSGVSAIVDPVGRVMVHGATFDQEALDSIVHWMHESTVYEAIGDVPWALLSVLLFVSAFVRRRKSPVPQVVLATFAAWLVGCSSVSSTAPADAAKVDAKKVGTVDAGGDDDAATDPPADAGICPATSMVDFGGPTCDSCAAAKCCRAASVCYGLADGGALMECAFFANCLALCGGAAGDAGTSDAQARCRTGCDHQYASARADYEAMEACLAKECENDAGTAPCNGTNSP